MVSPTTRWLVAIAAVALTAVAGCSTASDPPAPAAVGDSSSGDSSSAGSDSAGSGDSSDGACGSGSGFCITVDVTGAKTVQGTADTINLGSCADFVKGGSSSDGSLQLPGLLGEPVGGQEFSAVNEIKEYAGPGTYEKDALRSVAGVIDVSIDNTPYQPTDDTTAQAVINADGSGSFTFADLEEGEQGNPTDPKGTISGSYTWTCSD